MTSIVHPPGQIPVMEEQFQFKETHETRWSYGNIGSITKIFTASRMGCPLTMLQWQLKRFNLRLASYASNAEGSLKLLCDSCNKFMIMSIRKNPFLEHQGCSMCIQKTVFLDNTGLVSCYTYNILFLDPEP